MEGAARVFAGEFSRSTLVVSPKEPGSAGWVVTPGGAWCRQMMITGALTELMESGDLLRCRIADPTGAFDVVCSGKNTGFVQAVRKIPVPSFVLITGYAQAYQKNGGPVLSVRPDYVQIIDRTCRDQLMLTTAEYTLRRLEHLREVAAGGVCKDDRILQAMSHYRTTITTIRELTTMVEHAVAGVRSPGSPAAPNDQPETRTRVMDLIQSATGPRGIAVEEIIDRLVPAGIRKEDVLTVLSSLIQDDECYQPQKGYVRLL